MIQLAITPGEGQARRQTGQGGDSIDETASLAPMDIDLLQGDHIRRRGSRGKREPGTWRAIMRFNRVANNVRGVAIPVAMMLGIGQASSLRAQSRPITPLPARDVDDPGVV